MPTHLMNLFVLKNPKILGTPGSLICVHRPAVFGFKILSKSENSIVEEIK
jgi:hypothetical protein